MTLRLFIPRDAAAVSVGADEVATAIGAAAARQNVAVEIVRTGSRGLLVARADGRGRDAGGPRGLWPGRAGRRRGPPRRGRRRRRS